MIKALQAHGPTWSFEGCTEWYLRRHAVDVMSDAPVITPLQPLGEFVRRVGRHPGQPALATYLARLRERVRRPTPCCSPHA